MSLYTEDTSCMNDADIPGEQETGDVTSTVRSKFRISRLQARK